MRGDMRKVRSQVGSSERTVQKAQGEHSFLIDALNKKPVA